jgi:hypothetical protein
MVKVKQSATDGKSGCLLGLIRGIVGNDSSFLNCQLLVLVLTN